jgi:type IV pilus assembly protein PilV
MRPFAHNNFKLTAPKGKFAGLKRQLGVGMIEVLISIVIASFALLGLAGLQINSLRFQKVSHFRGLATQYGAEMSDRVRANMVGAIAGNYNPTAVTYGSGVGSAPTCAATKCTAAEIAAIDIYNWRMNLARGMAGGWGEISGNVTNGFTATVYFKEPDKTATVLDANCRAAALNLATDTNVRCFNTVFVP